MPGIFSNERVPPKLGAYPELTVSRYASTRAKFLT
jgi:hypothetical protein